MKIVIRGETFQNERSEPVETMNVFVEGDIGDKPEDVATAYKLAMDKLSEEEK